MIGLDVNCFDTSRSQIIEGLLMEKILASCLKNEAPYILEHYSWYKTLGFDKFFYIYNDCTDESPDVLRFLSDYDENVTVIHSVVPKHRGPQVHGYGLMLNIIKSKYPGGYCFCCDLDEFLVLHQHDNLNDFIQDLGCPDVISVNWRVFGSSGLISKSSEPVTKRFRMASKNSFGQNRHAKCMWKITNDIVRVTAHQPIFQSSDSTEKFWIVPSSTGHYKVDADFRNGKGWISGPALLDMVEIYHYSIKSAEEYSIKKNRGRGNAPANSTIRHTDDYFNRMDKNEVEISINTVFYEKVIILLDSINKEYNRVNNGNITDQGFDAQQIDNQEGNKLLPSLQKQGVDLLKKELSKANTYLEFGAGGSTIAALDAKVPRICTVDTSREWLAKVIEQAQDYPDTELQQIFIDIGPVKAWGFPTGKQHGNKWADYSSTPWSYLHEQEWSPNLVLIDGRFRCACFLTSWIFSREGTVILFDDYAGRDKYHIIETVAGAPLLCGRMARFVRPDCIDVIGSSRLLLKYINIPD